MDICGEEEEWGREAVRRADEAWDPESELAFNALLKWYYSPVSGLDPPKLVKHTQLLREWGEFQTPDTLVNTSGDTPLRDPGNDFVETVVGDPLGSDLFVLPQAAVRGVQKSFVCKTCGLSFCSSKESQYHRKLKVGFGFPGVPSSLSPVGCAGLGGLGPVGGAILQRLA